MFLNCSKVSKQKVSKDAIESADWSQDFDKTIIEEDILKVSKFMSLVVIRLLFR